MSDSRTCPTCGATLASDAPEGLCPKCLMENAAWSQTIAEPDDPSGAPTVMDPSAGTGAVADLPDTGSEFGGYRILRQLGRGGMGAVYEAEQIESGRRVALKILSHRLDSSDARRRFIREGRLAASINHPNSVYVFGTEEIEGTPAIAMEIVPGGTLQEQVMRDGPMPVTRAVDAILQIVEGLESAQAIGILHRDVKPSNCFVDERGVAKIGDFGLSISTEGRGDSHLTMQGSLLGTPAFASPEQLRGDELNARSDLYSVGATLFYLLTGHAPFEEANLVKLLARVLEEAPPDPRSVRSDIPKNLAHILTRCLAKVPSERFKSYAELRRALQPYSSESPTPATLALRFGAYMIDSILLGAVGFALQAFAWGSVGEVFNQANFGGEKYFAIIIGLNVMMASYFGFLEGLRGASLGKMLLRLRVIRPSGNLPGIPRAVLRALVLLAVMALPFWIVSAVAPTWMAEEQSWLSSTILGLTNFVTFGILFCLARRRNGFAGLHGLASGTRVVRIPAPARRPRLDLADGADTAPVDDAELIGPYHVIEPLGDSDLGRWFLAFDTRLLRRVWVHAVTAGTPPVGPMARNLNRPGRLRWITGRRSGDENWDAYEAPAGKSLSAILPTHPAWDGVRFWLADLAEECALASTDNSLPSTLAFNRVWITDDGHAKLLDFPAPGADPERDRFDDPVSFLRAIAGRAFETDPRPAPLHVRNLVADEPAITFDQLLSTLRQSYRRPASVSRLRRFGLTVVVSAFPVIAITFGLLFIALNHNMQKSNPELMELSSVTLAAQISQDDAERENLRRYIAHRYRAMIEDPDTWRSWQANMTIDYNRQRLARRALEDYPSLTAEQITAAEAAARPALKNKVGVIPELPGIAPLIIILTCWITYAAVPSLLMALAFRRGLAMMMFGTVVVKNNGEQASRPRAFWRGLLAWSPLLGSAILAGLIYPLAGPIWTTTICLVVIAVLVTVSHMQHGRTLHDRLAGTWLVPK